MEIHATEEALVKSVVEPFAHAYELDAETEKIVTDSLQHREITGVDDRKYVIALASVPQDKIPQDVQKYIDLYQNVPLMIAEKGEFGEWK